jgi:antitoxin (DNA-binding transcriptional repressor) of toxin-antitoxin stability system
MVITTTELRSHLGKYLQLASKEDIYITRNGMVVAKLSNPNQERVKIAESLFGILSADQTLEESRKEHLDQI